MSCLFPIEMRTKRGKTIQAPCRNCANCRALRKANLDVVYNIALQENYKKGYGASFITLTYDDDHIPILTRDFRDFHTTLNKKDSQDYMRTMRNLVKRAKKEGMDCNERYSYILSGEYGDDPNGTFRPHYHIAVLGVSAEQWATLSEKVWDKGIQQIEIMKGTSGIGYVTSYFQTAINRKEADRILNEYGFQAPYITRSRNTAIETIEQNFEKWTESGMRYYTRGKYLPLPRSIRERLRQTEGTKYEKTNEEMLQTIAEAKAKGMNAMDYDRMKSWIREYNTIQKLREKGLGSRSTYTFKTARAEHINYIQGETEL